VRRENNKMMINTGRHFLDTLKDKMDIIFVIFSLLLFLAYCIPISTLEVPIWDGAVYLSNAKLWLNGEPILEYYRPPLLSWFIGGIWIFTGENWEILKYIPALFAVGAGGLLYLTIKKYKGSLFAFAVTALCMLNTTLFEFSTQLNTESMSLFFLILTLYLLKSEKESHWFLAGIAIGLTFASRYSVVLYGIEIFLIEFLIIRKSFALGSRTILGAGIVILIVVTAVTLKTGGFETALEKDSTLSIFLSPFYVENSINIWGFAFLLVPIALVFRRTYTDNYNFTFIMWFIIGLLFWSANTSNHQFRFTIQFMPAVYFLAILGIENTLYYLKKVHARTRKAEHIRL
jgi:4-amino-4-deoxy-L-arabinose transferase-like glycosyltransferase